MKLWKIGAIIGVIWGVVASFPFGFLYDIAYPLIAIGMALPIHSDSLVVWMPVYVVVGAMIGAVIGLMLNNVRFRQIMR